MGHFPAPGFHYRFSGDANRGFGKDQPGGWLYNILPWIEEEARHSIGKGMTGNDLREAGRERVQTVVPTYICPSRGNAQLIPYTVSPTYGWWNINRPDTFARSDYAANAGDHPTVLPGYITSGTSGVVVRETGGIKFRDVLDGTSNTYMIGERYLNPDRYIAGNYPANDQGWTVGYDWDVIRYVQDNPNYAPRRDRAGIDNLYNFGSAHDVFNMARCDGSVLGFSYNIDPTTHSFLGNRNDGEVINYGD